MKLGKIVSKVEDMRIEVTENKLLRPIAFKVVGDRDFSSMTWKDFLFLMDEVKKTQ